MKFKPGNRWKSSKSEVRYKSWRKSVFILNNNLLGIDRFVPIGKALGIDIVWDGYEVVKSLSRVVSLE